MRVMDFYLHHEGRIRENWVPIDIIEVLNQMGFDVFDRMQSVFRRGRIYSYLSGPASECPYRRAGSVGRAQELVHRHGRLVAAGVSDDPRRHARHGLARRNVRQHDRARRDPAAIADLDVAEDRGALLR